MKKKLLSLLGITALIGSMLVGCEPEVPSNKKIALITDVGSIDDKSFNQGTWEGVKAYAKQEKLKENVNYKYFQPAGGESAGDQDYINAINAAIDWGAEIVVTPGFMFEKAIFVSQEAHPNVKFVLIDGTPQDGTYKNYHIANNTVSILFKEQESGFLAGYGAVKNGQRKLGYMGGMAVPAVVRFGVGYVAGAYQAAKELNLTDFDFAANRYKYLETFNPAPEIKTEAQSWYNNGIEVIFVAAGGAGSSVMAAANETTDKWMIGVDVDQGIGQNRVLTSATKGLQTAAVEALNNFYTKNFDIGGTQLNLGAKENGVGLPLGNTWRFGNSFTKDNYNTIHAKLGVSITVPTNHEELNTYVSGLGYTLKLTQAIIGA